MYPWRSFRSVVPNVEKGHRLLEGGVTSLPCESEWYWGTHHPLSWCSAGWDLVVLVLVVCLVLLFIPMVFHAGAKTPQESFQAVLGVQ